jgi:hypothetical protein
MCSVPFMTYTQELINDVANELRAEMKRQGHNEPALARALGIDIRTARTKYRGTVALTFGQVIQASAWLNVDRHQLLAPVLDAN